MTTPRRRPIRVSYGCTHTHCVCIIAVQCRCLLRDISSDSALRPMQLVAAMDDGDGVADDDDIGGSGDGDKNDLQEEVTQGEVSSAVV